MTTLRSTRHFDGRKKETTNSSRRRLAIAKPTRLIHFISCLLLVTPCSVEVYHEVAMEAMFPPQPIHQVHGTAVPDFHHRAVVWIILERGVEGAKPMVD